MSGSKQKKDRIYLQYHKSKETGSHQRLLQGWPILKLFLVLLKNRGFAGIQRYSILENGYEGGRQECLSLQLVTGENEQISWVRREQHFPERLTTFQISMKEYHLGRFKRFDSKIDERGVVESNSTNNAGLECWDWIMVPQDLWEDRRLDFQLVDMCCLLKKDIEQRRSQDLGIQLKMAMQFWILKNILDGAGFRIRFTLDENRKQ